MIFVCSAEKIRLGVADRSITERMLGGAATHVAANADAILRRVLRWQSIIYQEPTLAGMPWLKDQLVNCNPHELS